MLCREIEVTYKTAWLILYKIRHDMHKHDEKYTLSGIVELDDAYIGAHTEGEKKERGTEQTKIIVGLSLNKKGQPKHLKLKMNAFTDLIAESIKGLCLIYC